MATGSDAVPTTQRLNVQQRHAFVRKVGSPGAFGIVVQTKVSRDGSNEKEDRAVKLLEIEDESVMREMVCQLKLLDHPNIVRYYDHWIEDTAGWKGKWKELILERYPASEERPQMFIIELELCAGERIGSVIKCD